MEDVEKDSNAEQVATPPPAQATPALEAPESESPAPDPEPLPTTPEEEQPGAEDPDLKPERIQ